MFPYEHSKTVSVCLSVCPYPEKRNPPSFVNISPTLVIEASMERSSRVLQHGIPKIRFCSKKFEFWILTKCWNHLSFVNISPTLVIEASMERSSRVLQHGNPKMWFFFQKLEIDEIEFCPYPEKRSRPGLVNIQSYISNWYVNGKVFTSTTPWQPENLIFFFNKVRNSNFDLCWRVEIIQVGLNMHLYIDIGDASSSLWGSTSSSVYFFSLFNWIVFLL